MNTNKKVYRAGLIPYFRTGNEIEMLFMLPSDSEYGGDTFQLAKGKVEEGETDKEAAIREAKEELGFFEGNVVGEIEELGNFMGRTMVYIAEIKDKEMFGLPHHETSDVAWMTLDKFLAEGRTLHRPVVQAAMRKITGDE